MTTYVIRVVLHGATAADYELLHERMAAGGALRTITSDSGIVYDLPDGNYAWDTESEAPYVRDEVKRVADIIRDGASVLVSSGHIAWSLLTPPSQS